MTNSWKEGYHIKDVDEEELASRISEIELWHHTEKEDLLSWMSGVVYVDGFLTMQGCVPVNR